MRIMLASDVHNHIWYRLNNKISFFRKQNNILKQTDDWWSRVSTSGFPMLIIINTYKKNNMDVAHMLMASDNLVGGLLWKKQERHGDHNVTPIWMKMNHTWNWNQQLLVQNRHYEWVSRVSISSHFHIFHPFLVSKISFQVCNLELQ